MYTGVKQKHDDIIIMRALHLHNPKVFTGGKLSILFDVSKSTAEKTVSGKTWKYIHFPIQPYASEIAINFINQEKNHDTNK